MAVPHTLACYVPHGTLIMFDTMPIPISDVLSLCQAPISMLRHDHLTRTLTRVDRIHLPCMHIHTWIGLYSTGILTVFETPSLERKGWWQASGYGTTGALQ